MLCCTRMKVVPPHCKNKTETTPRDTFQKHLRSLRSIIRSNIHPRSPTACLRKPQNYASTPVTKRSLVRPASRPVPQDPQYTYIPTYSQRHRPLSGACDKFPTVPVGVQFENRYTLLPLSASGYSSDLRPASRPNLCTVADRASPDLDAAASPPSVFMMPPE